MYAIEQDEFFNRSIPYVEWQGYLHFYSILQMAMCTMLTYPLSDNHWVDEATGKTVKLPCFLPDGTRCSGNDFKEDRDEDRSAPRCIQPSAFAAAGDEWGILFRLGFLPCRHRCSALRSTGPARLHRLLSCTFSCNVPSSRRSRSGNNRRRRRQEDARRRPNRGPAGGGSWRAARGRRGLRPGPQQPCGAGRRADGTEAVASPRTQAHTIPSSRLPAVHPPAWARGMLSLPVAQNPHPPPILGAIAAPTAAGATVVASETRNLRQDRHRSERIPPVLRFQHS